MRIEINHFDQQGTIGTDVLDLSAEQVTAIVARARDLAILRRAGKPIARALDQLDDALMSANVIKGDEKPAEVSGKAAQAPELLEAYRDLKESAVDGPEDDDTVTVSRAALDGMGAALAAAVTASAQLQWQWKPAQHSVTHISTDRVLERMAQIVKMSGAPDIHEAMTKFPVEFCQVYESLVDEDHRQRAAAPGATKLVNLMGEDGESVVQMLAPPGLTGPGIQAAVERALGEMSPSDDVDALCNKLIGAGYGHVEHITVEMPAPDETEQRHDAPTA